MKGTMLDFLKLASEKPQLAEELVELACRHDFEFTWPQELSEEQLGQVAGGVVAEGKPDPAESDPLDRLQSKDTVAMLSREYTLLSNILKSQQDTAASSIKNVR